MGLFDFLKSASALPAEADDAFNALSATLNQEGDASARHRLWTATFGLDQWHFVDFAPKGNKPATPMHSSFKERSCVLAYTSRQRAEIAAKHYSDTVKVLSFAPLTLPRNEALVRICQLPKEKPEFALFNAGTGGNGFAENIPSLAAMSDFFLDELPEGAFHRLAQLAESVPDPTPRKRLIRRLAKLPAWHFIPDADHRDIPHLLSHESVPAFAIYTSLSQVLLKLSVSPDLKTRKPFERPPLSAIALLQAAMEKSHNQITQVIVNPGPWSFSLPISTLEIA